ncbi:Ras of Complex, Roc, domain of DAPkinase [Desmophyllum pertusum]|uniref:Ras of Complex, Roc, domain of DAPkinase n=1 Tax=Desmophyllum pertusum TaxID=174260 RepID=A0A9X0CF85_9CNID|nr:Ras of Complex, Roc, domain of DAPkinase [Desmophyllum pertusum]
MKNRAFLSENTTKKMTDDQVKPFKVIVFGEAGVGKSALSIRYVCQEFSSTYDPTIEDNYETDIEVDGCPIKVEVIDTAGNDVFRRMRDQYIKSGDGFILVYSIADRGSSHSMTAFHEQIIAAKGEKVKIIPQIPIILVGNKCDLDDEREVSYQDGKKIAATFSCPFS